MPADRAQQEKALEEICPLTVRGERKWIVPAELSTAQIMLESDWMQRRCGNFNIMGMKRRPRHKLFVVERTHEIWDQKTVDANASRIVSRTKLKDGRWDVVINDEFADFASLDDAVQDYLWLISCGAPYAQAFAQYRRDLDWKALKGGNGAAGSTTSPVSGASGGNSLFSNGAQGGNGISGAGGTGGVSNYTSAGSGGGGGASDNGSNSGAGGNGADGANTLSLQNRIVLPSNWTSTVDVDLIWFGATTTGTVVWQVATICVADGETDDPVFNTPSTVADTAKGSANQLNTVTISGITTTGCAAGEIMHLKVLRDPANASDTYADTARLVGITVTIKKS